MGKCDWCTFKKKSYYAQSGVNGLFWDPSYEWEISHYEIANSDLEAQWINSHEKNVLQITV